MNLQHYKPLSQLHEWQDNYNHGDVEGIAISIRRFGFNSALRVWRDDIIMAGNHSFLALKLIRQQGPKPDIDHTFPPANIIAQGDDWFVLWVDVSHLDEMEAKAYAIADNQLARKATADEALLAQYLQEIQDTDAKLLDATGFSERQVDQLITTMLNELNTPPDDPGAQLDRGEELREKWGTQPGQLWVIPSKAGKGAHRLLCGNSRLIPDVLRVMEGKRAELFATDPPYLVGYTGMDHPHSWNEKDDKKNKDWSETYHDWDDPKDGEALYDEFVRNAVQHAIAEDAAWYCWHASRHQSLLEQVWQRYGAFVHQQIIWAKDRGVLTHSWYMWQHEPCFFGWVKGKKPYRASDDYPTTVWNVPSIKPGTSTDHPTSKPVELFARPIEQHTRRGDVCYEPFSGSGTQFVAAEQLGRLVYGIEREPTYCAVILQRLADMGLEPQLLEG